MQLGESFFISLITPTIGPFGSIGNMDSLLTSGIESAGKNQ